MCWRAAVSPQRLSPQYPFQYKDQETTVRENIHSFKLGLESGDSQVRRKYLETVFSQRRVRQRGMQLLLIFLQIEQKNEIPKSYERTENFIEDLENKSYHSRLDYSKLQGWCSNHHPTLGFRCKGNNSISENVLFDRQNVFLWSDLTLLSTNISKKSTFA